IFVTEPWGNATYNSLQLQLERRMSGGLLLLASYAYGKTLTDVPNSTGDKGGTTAQNPYCLNSCEKGDPTYDLRQRFTANAVYAAHAPYTPGNLGYGTFLGPGPFNWDFSVYKTFSVAERHRLQFRTEFFNFPNHPNLGNPGLTVGTANFGKITSAGDPRVLQ